MFSTDLEYQEWCNLNRKKLEDITLLYFKEIKDGKSFNNRLIVCPIRWIWECSFCFLFLTLGLASLLYDSSPCNSSMTFYFCSSQVASKLEYLSFLMLICKFCTFNPFPFTSMFSFSHDWTNKLHMIDFQVRAVGAIGYVLISSFLIGENILNLVIYGLSLVLFFPTFICFIEDDIFVLYSSLSACRLPSTSMLYSHICSHPSALMQFHQWIWYISSSASWYVLFVASFFAFFLHKKLKAPFFCSTLGSFCSTVLSSCSCCIFYMPYFLQDSGWRIHWNYQNGWRLQYNHTTNHVTEIICCVYHTILRGIL